jgi:hypothetical protein
MRCFDVIGTEKLRTKKTNTYLADHLKIVLRNSQCSGDVFQCSEFLSRDEEWRWRVRDRAPDCIGTRRSKHRRRGTAVMREPPAFRYFNGGSCCATVA